MALSAKMEVRQGQALVMTPQLLQAIKLLQLSHVELQAFVENELERNPLLERDDAADAPLPAEERGESAMELGSAAGSDEDFAGNDYSTDSISSDSGDGETADWMNDSLSQTREVVEVNLGTSLDNLYQEERITATTTIADSSSGDYLPVLGTANGSARPDSDEMPGFEASLTADISLHDHLEAQLDLAVSDPGQRLIGRFLIDAVDDNGYLAENLAEMATRLGVGEAVVLDVLRTIQGFDPCGVACRDVAECLELQLRELDRFDPAMAAMVANLPMVAKRDYAGLRRVCGVGDEDIAEMIAEIRQLDPKPGRAFGYRATETVVPDVIIRLAPDGSWLIDLNPDTLPRVLVNQSYHARVSKVARSEGDKSFLAECLQNANWLTRSLEQRARTILKVASEIVRQQDGFFAYGVSNLRPLNLKTIADAIGMHESTVSRVTSNKYLICPRGVFEMKYFFSASIAATGHGDAHSAEAVRFRIKQLIEAETGDDVLSDDAIVTRLKVNGIDIARRTVAKYRESLKIASSMDRRRQKNTDSRVFA
jgi:RNA polymerase sigma-54 factor